MYASPLAFLAASAPCLISYICTAVFCSRNQSIISYEENQRVTTSLTGCFNGT